MDYVKEELKSVTITVKYEGNKGAGSNDFNSLQELKTWLDKHPLYAEKLGYTKGRKNNN